MMKNSLTVNTFSVIARCVEEGVAYGINRSYKHTDSPSKEQIQEEIEKAVVDEICVWFKFDEEME